MARPGRDTIYAPATGRARAAIAIIRLSGPAAHHVVSQLIDAPCPEPRRLVRRTLIARGGDAIDDTMITVFPDGASYTGEAMAEIHCHGGPAVLSAVLMAIDRCEGTRIAEPGEFTRRAVLDGRLDLTEAEGLGDLIAAETELQRRQAMRVMSGAVSSQVETWRAALLEARALVELTIDWADEEVPEDVTGDVLAVLGRLKISLTEELERSVNAEKLRAGFEVALVGPPNVGKSSLLNRIVGRDVAITSEIPGTTRDVIEARYDLQGVPVAFLDLAGLRDTDDPIERIGVDRARARAEAADLRVILTSHDTESLSLGADLLRPGDLTIWTKADVQTGPGLQVSAEGGDGVDALLDAIAGRLPDDVGSLGVLAHHRHRVAVENCLRLIERGAAGLADSGLDIVAEDLRAACAELERIVGRIGVEDVLGTVFGSFCLGK